VLFKIVPRLHDTGACHAIGADGARSDPIFDAATPLF